MAVEFYYELTGRKGKTLWDSLDEKVFEEAIAAQAASYEQDARPGGDRREDFIEEHLWDELNGDDLDAMAEDRPELKNKGNEAIKKWLKSHECPGMDEKEHIMRWAWERANFDGQTGALWDHFDHKDDMETALNFGLIRYPEMVDGSYVDGGRYTIPVEVANKILSLCEKRKKEGEKDLELTREISRLEKEAVEKLIRVTGFYCDIHGGRAEFESQIPRNEVLTCPSCGHPICPVCANCYDTDPKTIEDARRYLASCDDVSGMAYCGECGDWGEGFMLRFLKLVGCPIPPEYEGKIHGPRRASFYATGRVANLPDAGEIVAEVKRRFEEGTSGIIKIEHPTGVIWGFPERHPDEWVVTVLYPEER